MIQLDFLEAADGTPLTKSFRRTDAGGYEITPYPMLRYFNSYREEVDGIQAFHDALVRHAAQQHCLTKGLLKEEIRAASRQGMTDPAQPTNWLCLDLDFDEGWDSIDEFLLELEPAFEGVSYIFQHSASAGIRARQGLRGHIFVLLDTPMPPGTLKLWLRERNLNVGKLTEQLKLTASGLALRWPLDVTTCQSDKLLYIAPPVCENFPDPMQDQRFTLVRKDSDYAPRLPTMHGLIPAGIEEGTQATVAALREATGLARVKPKMKELRQVQYLANPDAANITEIKRARGFVYVNLNGGDSWGYYFPEDNPEFLFNFKGEPVVRLRDIAPDFYREMKDQLARETRESRNFIPLVFRDRVRDSYYNALYYPDEGVVQANRAANVQKLQHFMQQYGEEAPEVITDWTVEFDPTTLEVIDPDRQWLNTFQPSSYLQAAKKPDAKPHMPPTIGKVIESLCVGDKDVIWRFVNWLAYIVQTRKKTGTAWVFHGVSGTGKGVFLSHVLRPLFGAKHVLEYTVQQFEDSFNGPLEEAIIMWIDEFHYESARSSGLVMNKLKHVITESPIAIRAMHREPIMVPNYTNVIIATNHPDPVRLAAHDRRFNVAPSQEQKLAISDAQVKALTREVPQFVSYLMAHEVDEQQVRTVVENEARANMIQAAQTSVESMFEALRDGKLQYFLDYLQHRVMANEAMAYSMYEQSVVEWVRAAAQGPLCIVSLTEIQTAYQYIIGTPTSPAKLRRMLAVYRIPYAAEHGGAPVTWKVDMAKLREVIAARSAADTKPHLRIVKEPLSVPE